MKLVSYDIVMDYLIKPLRTWCKQNYRDYPWRKKPIPYKVMIAEFMLQRTKADQVVAVYNEFIEKYPDINSLANSDIKDISEIIKPLGLYWRSVHFKESAIYIQNEYRGIIPKTRKSLLKIPGIGDYAAGAILAVAFSKKTEIVDSNIARVLNRYFGLNLTGEIRRNKKIKKLSKELFSSNNPKQLLFCIIDFSAIICTPKNPKHTICPLKDKCIYYKEMNLKINVNSSVEI